MVLESWAARAPASKRIYPYRLTPGSRPDLKFELDWAPMIEALLEDQRQEICVPEIARCVHETLARALADLAARFDIAQVALTGGCFQNRLLTERSCAMLRRADKSVFLNRRVPPGDGGLALGQALWTRWTGGA